MLGIVSLSRTDRFQVLCRYPTPDFTGRNLGVLKNQRTGGNNRPLAHFTSIKQRRPHTDEGSVVDGTGMDSHVMSDGDIRTDMRRPRIVSYMYAGSVLNVGAVTDGDRGYITSHDGIEPDRAFVTQRDIAHDGCILAEIAVLTPLGAEAAITLDECHKWRLLRLLADISQDTTVDVEDVTVDCVGSVRSKEHSGTTQL